MLPRIGSILTVACAALAGTEARGQDVEIPRVFRTWCADCHTGEGPEGEFDITGLFDPDHATPDELTDALERAARRIRGRTMPPPDESEIPSDEVRHELMRTLAARAPVRPGARVATIRRLTRRQYERTITALFGIPWHAHTLLPSDASAHGFEGIGDVQNVSPLTFEKHLDAAADVATRALADEAATRRAFGDGTVEAAIPRLLRRAYRRPIDDEEISAFRTDVTAARARGSDEREVRHVVLRSILASPSFLFRAETGRPDKPWLLTTHEVATRLAFMLTAGPPDDELAAAADDGSLSDPDVLVRHALRLAQHRDGRAFAEEFATQWLSLREVLTQTLDSRRFPEIWNRQLRPSMVREVTELFAWIAREDRSVLELIDADYAFVNKDLAKLYGIPDVRGRKMRRVAVSDRRRGGVLSTSAVLMATSFALRTSPVKRGQWILAKLLDAPPPPPPPDAGTLPKDDKHAKGLTLRQQLEKHRADPGCAACHAEMDALGFALEHYDPLGRWRDDVHDQPVDAAATLPDGTEIDGPIALKDALLARSDDFVRAFAKNLLVHGVGRDMALADELELAKIVRATRAGGHRFSVLLRAVVTSPLFLMRDPDHER